MRLIFAGVAAALLVCVIDASPATAHWDFTRWGMTVDEVRAASANRPGMDLDPDAAIIAGMGIISGTYKTDDFLFRISFMFGSDRDRETRLMLVGLQIVDAENDKVLPWLKEKYGNHSYVVNRTPDRKGCHDRTLVWYRDDGEVVAASERLCASKPSRWEMISVASKDAPIDRPGQPPQ